MSQILNYSDYNYIVYKAQKMIGNPGYLRLLKMDQINVLFILDQFFLVCYTISLSYTPQPRTLLFTFFDHFVSFFFPCFPYLFMLAQLCVFRLFFARIKIIEHRVGTLNKKRTINKVKQIKIKIHFFKITVELWLSTYIQAENQKKMQICQSLKAQRQQIKVLFKNKFEHDLIINKKGQNNQQQTQLATSIIAIFLIFYFYQPFIQLHKIFKMVVWILQKKNTNVIYIQKNDVQNLITYHLHKAEQYLTRLLIYYQQQSSPSNKKTIDYFLIHFLIKKAFLQISDKSPHIKFHLHKSIQIKTGKCLNVFLNLYLFKLYLNIIEKPFIRNQTIHYQINKKIKTHFVIDY